MIVPSAVARRHEFERPYIEEVAKRVRDVVLAYCEPRGYAYTGRVKDTESVAEKIETGRFARWREIDDWFACSIVVPTLAEEKEAVEFLDREFRRVRIRDRSTTWKSPDQFRFDSTRFIGQLRADRFPDSVEIVQISFEVQVRTAFEHAWSVTTHALSYKGGSVDWRRVRLGAQLKAVVEQLDNSIVAFEELSSSIYEQQWPEISAKKQIEQYFREAIGSGRIPREAQPSSWLRFCDNLHTVVLGTTDRFIRDSRALVKEALEKIDEEVKELSAATFPRSLSLLQFCLGSLAKRGMIASPVRRYTALVTDELRSIYPQAGIMGSGFDCGV